MNQPDDASPSRWQGRASRLLAARLDPGTYLGLHLTVTLIAAALGLWLFGALLDALLDNATMVRWDVATSAAIHARVTQPGLRAFTIVSQLGSPAAMAFLAVAGAAVLWRQRRRTLVMGWIAAFAGGGVLDAVLKSVVHRDRPAYGTGVLVGHSYSFPSGHAMGSLIGYGMLAFVLARHWHPRAPWRRVAAGAAALLVLAVGVSRLYLGVHYPSDVLGGWAAGAAWLAACVAGVGIARQRQLDRLHAQPARSPAPELE